MSLNVFDYILLLLLLYAAWRGYCQGLIKVAGSMVAVIAGVIIAVLYREPMADWLQRSFSLQAMLAETFEQYVSTRTAVALPFSSTSFDLLSASSQYVARMVTLAIAFLILFIASGLIINLAAGVLQRLFSAIGLNGINRIGGVLISIVKQILIISIILGLIVPFLKIGSLAGWDKAYMASSLVDNSILGQAFVKLYAFLGLWL